MALIAQLFGTLRRRLDRIGQCGQAGLIVGAAAGGLLSLLSLIHAGQPLGFTSGELFASALTLSGFSWALLLFVFVVLTRRRLGSVLLPSLFNALLVTFLITYISALLDAFILSWLIGIVVGALVGYLLCLLSTQLTRRGGDGTYHT